MGKAATKVAAVSSLGNAELAAGQAKLEICTESSWPIPHFLHPPPHPHTPKSIFVQMAMGPSDSSIGIGNYLLKRNHERILCRM